MKKLIVIALGIALVASPALARQLDSTHRDWSVYTHSGQCYIVSAPTKQSGNYNSRGEPYLLVTTRKGAGDEINASSGYPYQTNSEVTVSIEGKRFKLFTKDQNAWAYDAAADAAMVKAMKSGNRMTVRGTSQRGTWSEDTYSLMGISAAYNRMKALCR